MDLQKLLIELNAQMTDAEIGIVIGAPQSTVTRLRTGKHKRTFYERGQAIVELAKQRGIIDNGDSA